MSVRIVAALAWFDEPPASLARLVHSLHGVADTLVAFDGRWDLYPDQHDLSSHAEIIALELARDHGLGLEIHRGAPFDWESQVVKRDRLMQRAGELCDWVLVVDGDTFFERFDSDHVRAELEQTDRHVAEITVRNLNRPFPLRHLAPQQLKARLLYRAGTRVVGPAHNDYVLSVGEGAGQWRWRLNGDPQLHQLAPALDLTDHVTLAHDNRNRGPARNAAAAAYRRARRAAGVEIPAT